MCGSKLSKEGGREGGSGGGGGVGRENSAVGEAENTQKVDGRGESVGRGHVLASLCHCVPFGWFGKGWKGVRKIFISCFYLCAVCLMGEKGCIKRREEVMLLCVLLGLCFVWQPWWGGGGKGGEGMLK